MSDKGEEKPIQKKKLKYSDEESNGEEEVRTAKSKTQKNKSKANGSDDDDNEVITYEDDVDSDEPKKKSKDKAKGKDKAKDKGKEKSKTGDKRKADGDIEEKNGEVMIHIHRLKKVTISKFKGQLYVGIREYYEKDGDILPTKKGCNLPLDAWEKLKESIPQIDAAVRKLK